MEKILQDMQNVCIYIDDLLDWVKLQRKILKLRSGPDAIWRSGRKAQAKKVFFMLLYAEYLGFKISEAGLQPTAESWCYTETSYTGRCVTA